jgi:hypothetical protein
VIGCCGAGKTQLSRRLACALGLPMIHLDDEYWGPGWRRPAAAAWRATVERIAAGPAWIIDGNYLDTLDLRLARAELAIFLDPPTPIALGRVLLRDARRALGERASLPRAIREVAGRGPGPGRLRFWGKVLGFRRRTRPAVLALLARAAVPTLALRSRRDAAHLLEALGAE